MRTIRTTQEDPASQAPDDQTRRWRRAELLVQRERAAARRRRRGFGVRLPAAQPLVLPDRRRLPLR